MPKRLLLAALVALPACVPVVVPVPIPLPQTQAPPKPQVEIIGREPPAVIGLLGSPSFDRTEGPARQLQFAGTACVLDVFFYPDRRTGRVAATHLEARTPAGQPFDAKACAETLAKPAATAVTPPSS